MNPNCPKITLLGTPCRGTLRRQHSGRRGLLVCTANKNHKYPVSSVLLSSKEETPEVKK